MPVTVTVRPDHVVELQVVAATGATYPFTFSLQRHHFSYLEHGDSAAMNSVISASVTVVQVQTDMRELGAELERRIDLLGGGIGNNAPTKALLWFDFTATSQRVYRVDHVNPNEAVANHVYVIRGPGVWGGMSREQWQCAKAVREIQAEVSAGRVVVASWLEEVVALREQFRALENGRFMAYKSDLFTVANDPGLIANITMQTVAHRRYQGTAAQMLNLHKPVGTHSSVGEYLDAHRRGRLRNRDP